jgi:hypothetical protein
VENKTLTNTTKETQYFNILILFDTQRNYIFALEKHCLCCIMNIMWEIFHPYYVRAWAMVVALITKQAV